MGSISVALFIEHILIISYCTQKLDWAFGFLDTVCS